MKKLLLPVLCGFLLMLFPGCLKDKLTHTYLVYTPIYKSKLEVTLNIQSNGPKEIGTPGNFFIYDHYIFLNEVDKGVHIIDNTDHSHPVEKAFIDIPGNLDIAVKGNILYADMYQDLVVVDISDPLHAKLLKDIPDVFPERYYGNSFVADRNMIIVGWTKVETTEDLEPSRNYVVFPGGLYQDMMTGNAAKTPGISGSMARFTIVNNYMYAVDNHSLKPISIANPAEPVIGNLINAGWDIETIYPFKNKLFLGSMGGLFIYDISQPGNPVKEGDFVHARACDPVVADDDYAYVTLREGTNCGPTNNELQVLNVQNLQAPTLTKTYPMTNPFGLSKDGNTLFICDGTGGLKMYDASDPANLILKKQIGGVQPYDAIAWNHNLIVAARDGLYQYDYSNPNDLVPKSKLSVNR